MTLKLSDFIKELQQFEKEDSNATIDFKLFKSYYTDENDKSIQYKGLLSRGWFEDSGILELGFADTEAIEEEEA